MLKAEENGGIIAIIVIILFRADLASSGDSIWFDVIDGEEQSIETLIWLFWSFCLQDLNKFASIFSL